MDDYSFILRAVRIYDTYFNYFAFCRLKPVLNICMEWMNESILSLAKWKSDDMYQQLPFSSLENAGVCLVQSFILKFFPIESTVKINALGNRDSIGFLPCRFSTYMFRYEEEDFLSRWNINVLYKSRCCKEDQKFGKENSHIPLLLSSGKILN